MPKPMDVNAHNFELSEVIFNNDDFSIAIGTWRKTKKRMAMRWNGEDNESLGYPNIFGKPMWFIIDESLGDIFFKSLKEKGLLLKDK